MLGGCFRGSFARESMGEEEDIVNDMDNRGLLRTIKVPFDVKAIMMGAVGYFVFIFGGWILDSVFEEIANHLSNLRLSG